MILLPKVTIRGLDRQVIFVQGGMGAGISLGRLAGEVARRGGVGTVSFVALNWFVSKRLGRKVDHYEAAKLEIEEAKRLSGGHGAIALNVMTLLKQSYAPSIKGAIAGGVDIIFAGAGMALTLPEIVGDAKVALVPIVSSGRALRLICQYWWRHYKRIPDAVILEGPLAGGHLGFNAEDITKPEFQLENIFGPVKEAAQECGGFPVIVAGGIYTREDIIRWINAGADGVQMGTRFLATVESNASAEFKLAVVAAREQDIEVVTNPGSPAGLAFRILNNSPGYLQAQARNLPLKCDLGYMLHKDRDGKMTCLALEGYGAFCICKGLLGATVTGCHANPIFTVGANAARVDRILPVNELMDELGIAP